MISSLIDANEPDRIALITQDNQHISYGKLCDDIYQTKSLLMPSQLVFIIAKNDYMAVLFYLCCLEQGAIALIIDADSPLLQIKHLLDTYTPAFIVAPSQNPFEQDDYKSCFNKMDYTLFQRKQFVPFTPYTDLAFLMSTSGSTGSPKLVRFTKQNLIANALSIQNYLEISPDDRAIANLPISYSYGLSIINSHLIAGASLVLSNLSLMDKSFWETMRHHKVTSFAGVPYHYEMLLRLKLENLNLPHLKKMTQAGGALKVKYLEKIARTCKSLNIRFWTMYGQTEASPRIAYLPDTHSLDKLGSIGKAIPEGKLWITDETGRDITLSTKTGMLMYQGENVSLGYAETLQDLSKGDENNGILKTGDLARCDEEGFFFIEGRVSRFLKIFGKRISLDQIEKYLHDKINGFVATGKDDLLVIAVKEDCLFDQNSLKKDISEYAGIHSSSIKIVVVAEIPRFETGKIDYQCLKHQLHII